MILASTTFGGRLTVDLLSKVPAHQFSSKMEDGSVNPDFYSVVYAYRNHTMAQIQGQTAAEPWNGGLRLFGGQVIESMRKLKLDEEREDAKSKFLEQVNQKHLFLGLRAATTKLDCHSVVIEPTKEQLAEGFKSWWYTSLVMHHSFDCIMLNWAFTDEACLRMDIGAAVGFEMYITKMLIANNDTAENAAKSVLTNVVKKLCDHMDNMVETLAKRTVHELVA